MPLRATIAAGAAVIGCGVACASASAGEMDGLVYTASPGEVNRVTVSYDGASTTLTDTAGAQLGGSRDADGRVVYTGQGCAQVDANSFRCEGLGIVVELGDRDDSFSYAGPAPGAAAADPESPRAFTVSGGDGDDTITGSPYGDDLDGSDNKRPHANSSDTVSGGLGDDAIRDYDGARNTLDGGAGNDIIHAANPRAGVGTADPAALESAALESLGNYTIKGGPGKDYVRGGYAADTIDGGEGDDDVYGSLGRDAVRGGAGNDSVDGGPGRDVSDGGAGRDFVQASFHGGCGGPDTLIGGTGRDTVYVYCGSPTILLRDGAKDTGSCRKRVKPARVRVDRVDRLKGACAPKKR